MEGVDIIITTVTLRLLRIASMCPGLRSIILSTNKRLLFSLLQSLMLLDHHW